jgi:uncharacterized protein YkwD
MIAISRTVRCFAAAATVATSAFAQAPPVTLSVTLSGEPAVEYRTGEPIADADRGLAGEVARRFPALHFSSNLAHAARELGSGWSGGNLASEPHELITFLLHSGGCPDPAALAAVVSSTSDDTAAVWDKLATCLREADEPFTDVGVARVRDPGGTFAWRSVILMVRRRFALQPVPRAVAAGAELRVAFSLAGDLRSPEIITISPAGVTRRAAAKAAGALWEAVLALGDERGEHGIELLADDDHGPHVLALFPVAVAAAPPRQWRGEPPPSEAAIASVADAERYLRELTDRDRTGERRAALTWDPALAAVARAHSEDMRDNAFMGHVSARTGDLGDRLHRADYAFAFAAENIARSTSLWEAMASLMRSPGHRRNLLSPEVTHGGIGVAIATDAHGERTYLVTQVFARPAPRESPRRPGASPRREVP